MSVGNWPEPRLTGYRSTTWMIFPAKQKEYGATIGVITVPVDKAQEVTELIIAGGIKALWNFTPSVSVCRKISWCKNTSMYAHLAVMFNR